MRFNEAMVRVIDKTGLRFSHPACQVVTLRRLPAFNKDRGEDAVGTQWVGGKLAAAAAAAAASAAATT